jgi:hypothetical protein
MRDVQSDGTPPGVVVQTALHPARQTTRSNTIRRTAVWCAVLVA